MKKKNGKGKLVTRFGAGYQLTAAFGAVEPKIKAAIARGIRKALQKTRQQRGRS